MNVAELCAELARYDPALPVNLLFDSGAGRYEILVVRGYKTIDRQHVVVIEADQ